MKGGVNFFCYKSFQENPLNQAWFLRSYAPFAPSLFLGSFSMV